MPFDSTLPVNGSPVVAAELRSQFNALKDLIDAPAAQIVALQNQMSALPTQFPARVDNLDPLQQMTSDPPTQAEVPVIANTVDAIITGLQGP